jgi:hypothetical protein
MNLVSDRRANLALKVLIVAGLMAGTSAIAYARFMDHRADVTAREGVTFAGILAMKSRAAAARFPGAQAAAQGRTGVRATIAIECQMVPDGTLAEEAGADEVDPVEETPLDEAAIFQAPVLPPGTLILRD